MFDLGPVSRPSWLSQGASWLWRRGPRVAVIAGVLLFLGGELLDRIRKASLRRARCTVASAKTESQLRTYGKPLKAWYVEETTVEFEIDGVGPRRTVRQVHDGHDFQVGQVRACWVAGERMYLYPEADRQKRRRITIAWSLMLSLSGLLWLWTRS